MRHLTLAAGLSTTILALAGAGGIAEAATGDVVSTIKAQDKIIKSSPAYKQLTHFVVGTPAQAKTAIPTFAALKMKIDAAATAVSQASATTAQQRAGQADWVRGARELATGIGTLETALKDIESHDTAGVKANLKQGALQIKRADRIGLRGDKLLGLPAND